MARDFAVKRRSRAALAARGASEPVLDLGEPKIHPANVLRS
jgi:hypothetical protein